jgi:hypothetical protein
MANELIRPIDADTARAIEEASKAVGKAIDASVRAGNYAGDILGNLPRDLVGLIGDWVAHKRARNWARLQADTNKLLQNLGVENREDVSPSVAIPLIEAALDEDREGLRQLWAKLLAAAMDPGRAHLVRLAFIDTVKRMDPMDAAVLQGLYGPPLNGAINGASRNALISRLSASQDEMDVSIENLAKLGLVRLTQLTNLSDGVISAFGREFLRTVSN